MKNCLKKVFLIIIISLSSNYLYSQEIQSVYKFKKEEQKKIFYYYELDSLILYKNGSFYRKQFYQYHQINYLELKGSWKIENGILYLNISDKKTSRTEKDWTKFSGKFTYLAKKRKLIPTNDGYQFDAHKKLKLLK